MKERIKIKIAGTPDQLKSVSKHTQELRAQNFEVEFKEIEQDDTWDCDTGPISTLAVEFVINHPFLTFIGQQGANYVIKEYLFKPFFEWLTKVEETENIIPPDNLVFKYDDITIKVAYSRKNHFNAVGLVSLWLVELIPFLSMSGHGNLTTVVSPVSQQSGQWKFETPPNEFFLDDFLLFWGLEFNNSNRCVFQPRLKNFIYQHWW